MLPDRSKAVIVPASEVLFDLTAVGVNCTHGRIGFYIDEKDFDWDRFHKLASPMKKYRVIVVIQEEGDVIDIRSTRRIRKATSAPKRRHAINRKRVRVAGCRKD